jgi:release factor glutamine methyltransferase
MRPNVLNHEPHLALFVSNEDPLLFYRKIAMLAKDHLNLGGMLCFEINEAFGEETVALLDEMEYKQIELINDRFGKNRIVSAIR